MVEELIGELIVDQEVQVVEEMVVHQVELDLLELLILEAVAVADLLVVVQEQVVKV